jgi:adenine phosphoribosyltransferase
MDLRSAVRSIKDFPTKGILFRDITPVLLNPEYLAQSINKLCDALAGVEFDLVLGPESRGFIFGVPVAFAMKKGFVPVRKAGRLPYSTIKKSYALEYGNAEIEIHTDAIQKGEKVVIVDDLLATGGTCKALAELVESAGGIISAMAFFIELSDLRGREVLKNYNIKSIITY